MPDDPVSFDRDGARRIVNAVRRVEGSRLPAPREANAAQQFLMPVLVGKAPAKITAGSTGTFNVWRGTGAAAAYIPGDDVQLYARLGDVPPNSFTYVTFINGGWEPLNTQNCS